MMADLTIDDKETPEQKTRSDTIAKIERVGLNELWSASLLREENTGRRRLS